MAEKEFNLSEMINVWGLIDKKDVKEFIKRRNRLDMMLRNDEIGWIEYIEERNKLSGEKLR